MSEAWIALVAALFGGAGLKIIESLLNRSKRRADVATQIRQELREEIQGLKKELRTIETDLDNWKMKYYNLLEGFNELKFKLIEAGMEKELRELEAQMNNLE